MIFLSYRIFQYNFYKYLLKIIKLNDVENVFEILNGEKIYFESEIFLNFVDKTHILVEYIMRIVVCDIFRSLIFLVFLVNKCELDCYG